MNELARVAGDGAQGSVLVPAQTPAQGPGLVLAQTPALYAQTPRAAQRTLEFFAANIRNPNTRRAYARAAAEFSSWCQAHGLVDVCQVQPVHVAAYVESLQTAAQAAAQMAAPAVKQHLAAPPMKQPLKAPPVKQRLAAPSVKQHLAALRSLFDWLVVGQVMPMNPASSVRGPRHSVKKGKTPVLTAAEARTLLDSIDVTTPMGLRDRALIGLMTYTFARVGAAVAMKAQDVYIQGRRTWVRLHEKGGKEHEMPCHHNLEEYLQAYVEGAGLALTPKGALFRTATTRSGALTERAMSSSDVYRMIGRRALAAGIPTRIGCHTFRATGITEYLKNGGKLEVAQAMANHESARTTGLYDRRADQVNLDEVERILI